MTAQKNSERRKFDMHPNLLYDVITKQAGSLQKAVLEGVMNGVDAGASRIDITLTERRVRIVDDGKGFLDRAEIDNFFETFGTPHQEGDAHYGRFRMGRGQMFSFGINRWRTNVFEMDVDIKANGLDYDLKTVEPHNAVKGCDIVIDLYEELLPSDCDQIQRELKHCIAYVSTPVYLNGRMINQNPSDGKWHAETDDAWFKLSPDKAVLSIYNLGVLVVDAPAHRFGTGGIIVSKERLDVNFARNDVQNTCKVFGRIKAELRKHSDQSVTRKKRVTDQERTHLAGRLLDGSVDPKTGLEFPVITDVEGRHHKLAELMTMIYGAAKIFVAPRGNRQASIVTTQRLGTAIAQETLDRFDADDMPDFIEKLKRVAARWQQCGGNWMVDNLVRALNHAKPVEAGVFGGIVKDNYEPIPERDQNQKQRVLRRALQAGMYPIAAATGQDPRVIGLGYSDVAQAWTDGVGQVWFNVSMLPLLGEGYQGCVRLAGIMLHEFMHEGPDTDTHDHDGEFYKRYHDLSLDDSAIGESVAAMMRYLAKEARSRGKAPSRMIGIFEDSEALIVKSGGKGSSASDRALALAEGHEQQSKAA